jgi:hypothetical protein
MVRMLSPPAFSESLVWGATDQLVLNSTSVTVLEPAT